MPSELSQEQKSAAPAQERSKAAPALASPASRSRFPEIFFSVSVVLFVSIRIAGPAIKHASAWSSSDWMIDYAGGFVRRGLGGALIAHLMHWTGWSFPVVVECLTVPVYLLLCLWLVRTTARLSGPALWRFLLLFNPFLLISAADSGLFDRKDTLFLGATLVNVLLARSLLRGGERKGLRAAPFLLYLAVVSTALALLHEGLFLFAWLPLNAALTFFLLAGSGWTRRAAALLLGITVLPALTATAASVLRHGNAQTAQAICSSWEFTGTVNCAPGPHFPMWLGLLSWSLSQAISVPMTHAWTLPFCLAFFLAGAGLLLLAVRTLLPESRMEHLLATLLFPLACSLPLFVLGIDWGRWLLLVTLGAAFFLLTPPLQPAIYGCLPRSLQELIRLRAAPAAEAALAGMERAVLREPKFICFLVVMFPVPPTPIWWSPLVINPISVLLQFVAEILKLHAGQIPSVLFPLCASLRSAGNRRMLQRWRFTHAPRLY